MSSILIFFHCASNTGYAIASLEKIFFTMAEILVENDWNRIHFAYPDLAAGRPETLPQSFTNIIEFDPQSSDREHADQIAKYIAEHRIDVAFGFDQPVHRPIYRHLRRAGVQHFISYWGAPISGPQPTWKLWLKRLEVALRRHGPDHYIFESKGMANSAVLGRGIAADRVSVVYLSVDLHKFIPNSTDRSYVYDIFRIPTDRKIFFYSGHMEHRKGVHILISAAKLLVEQFKRSDFHLLILGNKNGEERAFAALMDGHHASHVTFGGYRNDLNLLHRGCFGGLIGSTGWDSLTCSAIEMAASGLPLIVSNLPGLRETVVNNETGFLFPIGDAEALARRMIDLIDNPTLARSLGNAARLRAEHEFSQSKQIQGLADAVRRTIERES